MRQSKLFTKTRREAPKDETSRNAELLIRGGFIHKELAGSYAFLPLGLRVLENIKRIIREEMEGLGAQEILMTTLQRKELWEKTQRWDDKAVDVWFKSELKSGGEVGFGWSHEEPISNMLSSFIGSYRDLPLSVHQFQTKLRNELRAKSGILRGREFLMNDMYSFSKNTEEHQAFYDGAIEAYHRVFERVGLGDQTYFTVASGGAFTEFSHEFQTLSDVGEDTIYLDRGKRIAINKEVYTDEVLEKVGLEKNNLEEVSAIEVGNIFSFGDAKSRDLNLAYTDEDGNTKYVVLGSYGIGVTRLMGTIAEIFHDDRGLLWPRSVAPFDVHLIALTHGEGTGIHSEAETLYMRLNDAGIWVLYDERDQSAGEKFADADLIGIPLRVVISDKMFADGNVELKHRSDGEGERVAIETLHDRIKELMQE